MEGSADWARAEGAKRQNESKLTAKWDWFILMMEKQNNFPPKDKKKPGEPEGWSNAALRSAQL